MLEYFALFLVIFVTLVLFYGIIVIHDIPYEIAKERNHPQQDAIHVAGWVSLFTLHVLWPFLWIWATLYREDRGWGFNNHNVEANNDPVTAKENKQIAQLSEEMHRLKAQVNTLEKKLNDKEV